MDWIRGDTIGYGSFSTVSLAKRCSEFPYFMAVKSSDLLNSDSLENEKQVLDQLGVCPQIVRCFGDDQTLEDGEKLYNLFLEYASRGSLADQLKKSDGVFPESDVRRYVRSILKGLIHVHSKGFAHCDVKLQNILMFDDGEIKIADFGLAKRTGEVETEVRRVEFRGTPLYMSPESVNDNVYDSPTDIWALGCAVVEMVTGKPAWNCKQGLNIPALLIMIGVGDELPAIPGELSDEGKDFLGKCFVKDPTKRWTAQMLLDHPFITVDSNSKEIDTVPLFSDLEVSESPRGPFDFANSISVPPPVKGSFSGHTTWVDFENSPFDSSVISSEERIMRLVCDRKPHWSVSGSWVTVW